MTEGERFYKAWEVPANFGKPEKQRTAKRRKLDNQMTETEVFERLKFAFPPPAHVLLPQVKVPPREGQVARIADALCASVYESRGLWLAGIEIKVTRTDFMKELRDPEKSEPILRYCKYYYLATPTDLVSPEELMEGWGLVYVRADGAKVVRRAEPRDGVAPPDMGFVCSVLRAAAVSLANTAQEEVVHDDGSAEV